MVGGRRSDKRRRHRKNLTIVGIYNLNKIHYHSRLITILIYEMKLISRIFARIVAPVFAIAVGLSLSFAAQADNLQQLLQLVDYVGVDYAEAVADGKVIHEGEYQEMQDFSSGIAQLIQTLPDGEGKQVLQQQAARLAGLVADKADASEVRRVTATMRESVIANYQVTVVPRKQVDLQRGAALYAEQCASCHGAQGDGNGPLAKGLEPPPIDFTDRERYAQRTLYGLYNTITQGVADTSMQSYHELPAEDRWALAFYVGSIAAQSDADRLDAETLLADPGLKPLFDVQKLTVTTPAEAAQQYGEAGAQLMAYLRTHPELVFQQKSPLTFSRNRLDDVLAAYRAGDSKQAYQLAVEAYLEGFELVEQALNAIDPALRLRVEQDMTTLRTRIRQGAPLAELEQEVAAIQSLLDESADRLQTTGLSGGAAFTAAFFILLREGLEAILVVAALAAFLVKTGHRQNMRYLHAGWIGALVLGFFTWWASVSLVEISGTSREVTEGLAALLATAILFYVGFWLHDKTSAAQWKKFIETHVNRALSSGTLWGLAGLSFIAVYREVFETILFYQALWVQADEAGQSMALAGFVIAAGILAVLALLIMRYSARLPLRQFFSVTGILMFVLAVIFAGKGVAAMSEAGYIPYVYISFPRIELLGIYPNLPGLLLQLGLLLLALYLWFGWPGGKKTAG